MELFDKIYSCYYQVVKMILEVAANYPVTEKQMKELIRKNGYQESVLTIFPRLTSGEWALLKREHDKTYTSVISHLPRLPLTGLQKRWLKSLLSDRRIALFLNDEEKAWAAKALEGILPLYRQEDFHYFDRYGDGDDYSSARYQENFRLIVSAIEEKRPLFIAYEGKRGDTVTFETLPCQLQYSSKDDKFRLYSLSYSHGCFCRELVLNMARMKACHRSKRAVVKKQGDDRHIEKHKSQDPVVIEISGERNSLERCMLHFANYEKHTEYDKEGKCYLCSIYYHKEDETELLIDILSFGPVIRILGPEPFLSLVKARVRKQHMLLSETKVDGKGP